MQCKKINVRLDILSLPVHTIREFHVIFKLRNMYFNTELEFHLAFENNPLRDLKDIE